MTPFAFGKKLLDAVHRTTEDDGDRILSIDRSVITDKFTFPIGQVKR